MEAINIVASIASLANLSEVTFIKATKYAKSMTVAQKEVGNLLGQVKATSLLLRHLYMAAAGLEMDSTAGASAEYADESSPNLYFVNECQSLLERLDGGLDTDKADTMPSSELEKHLEWPFSSRETDGLVDRLQRLQSTFDLALTVDSLRKLKQVLSRKARADSIVKEVQKDEETILDIKTTIRIDKKRQNVLSHFEKADFRSEFEMSQKLRHPSTGMWLTQSQIFQDWYNVPGSRIWFTGVPGAGTSVLSGAIIAECLRISDSSQFGVAYFFCSYRNFTTHDPIKMLSSLAAQLSRQNESAYKLLQSYYNDLDTTHSDPEAPTLDGLIQILPKICNSFGQVHLVIDGVDECGAHVDTMAQYLRVLASSTSNLSMALFSRDEPLIRRYIESDFRVVDLEPRKDDMRRFISSELDERIRQRKLKLRNIALKQEILMRLVDESNGSFRWVACQLDHMCALPTDKHRREALNNLPPTLTDTYERILTEIEASPARVKDLVKRTLKIINVTKPLNIRAMSEAVSVPGDSEVLEDAVVGEDEILSLCRSLVRKSNDGKSIEYAHITVFEFLRDISSTHPQLSDYNISDDSACHMFDNICLRFLTMQKFNNLPNTTGDVLLYIKERIELHPFYEQAAITWPRINSDDRPHCISDYLLSLFPVKKTAAFSSWAITLVLYWTHPTWKEDLNSTGGGLPDEVSAIVSAILSPEFTPLHMAAALGLPHVCARLADGTDANLMSGLGAPLHFAIGSRLIFEAYLEEWDKLPWNPREGKYPVRDVQSAFTRRRTVQLLLEKGARADLNPELSLAWPWPSTLMSLAVVSSTPNKDFEVVSDLIRAGATLEEDDFGIFYELYNHIVFWDGFKEFNDSVLNLLQVLGSKAGGDDPISVLHGMTLQFSEMLAFDAYQVENGASDEFVNDQLAKEYLYQITRKSDVAKMAKFLRGTRAELVKSTGFSDNDPSWTLLHCAAWYGSIDIMRMLLEAGCNPDQVDDLGKTPLHMCQTGNALQILIQYGGSPFILDNKNSTIWYDFVHHGKVDMLEILLEKADENKILEMEERMNCTLIDLALERNHKEAALLLLGHNSPGRVFQNRKSIYQHAAKFNSPEFARQLIELGVPADGIDDVSGNPLHHLSDNPNFEVVEILTGIFPLDHRRRDDDKTPFELAVTRAASRGCWLSVEICLALLPEESLVTPPPATDLWIFLCEDVLWAILNSPSSSEHAWLQDLFIYVIESGVISLFEEETRSSALVLFSHHALHAPEDSGARLASLGPITHSNPAKVERLQNWKWISSVFERVARKSRVESIDVQENPDVIAMLIESIIHDDGDMIAQILQMEVSVHGRFNNLSPLEVACLPHIELSEASFDHILGHASVKLVDLGNEVHEGYGLLHFTAGNQKVQGSVWKLQRLLQAGLDCNLPVPKDQSSPLVHHILNKSTSTAEVLVDYGADLWAANCFGFDAPLAATWTGNPTLLAKIHTFALDSASVPMWDNRWESNIGGEDLAGGNALHIAAVRGRLDCLRYYVEEDLLSDVSATDVKLQTPLHYAAMFGRPEIVEYLESKGANVNATSASRETPLHLAAKAGHLETVEVLLQLGAHQSACSSGYTPFVYAHIAEDGPLVEILQSHRFETKMGLIGSKELSIMVDGLSAAILDRDIGKCQMWLDLGCPLDIELKGFPDSTPLCKTILDGKSPELVEWLLDNGADVSAVLPNPDKTRVCTALEAAMSKPSLTPLLPDLITVYFAQGGNFLNMEYSPLHIAVEKGHLEGLLMVLELLQEWDFDHATPIPSPHHKNTDERKLALIYTAVNQKDVRFNGGTPLHVASRVNDVEAAEFLIDNMADIDAPDMHDGTPLFVACASGSTEVAKVLIRNGAQIDTLSIQGETPHMAACRAGAWEIVHFMLENCEVSTRPNYHRRNSLSFMLWAEPPPPLETFLLLLSKGFDLHQTDLDGFSTIHWLLGHDSPKYLEAVLQKHSASLRWRDIRWPVSLLDQVYDFPIRSLSNISKKLPLLRKHLNDKEMRYISDLAFLGKHNLVCQAACWGIVEALENFIQHGADVTKACPEHGSLLQAAASNSRLETVKFLVHSGVPVPVQIDKLFVNRLAEKRINLPILYWLSQSRYFEQKRLDFGAPGAAERKVVNWSGIVTMRIPRKWEWRRPKDVKAQTTSMPSLSGKVVSGGHIVGSTENSRFTYIIRDIPKSD